jgi:hypothetical protein
MENSKKTSANITADTINDIYKDAINDPELLSSIDVDDLLDSLETTNNDYLENKTFDSITKEVYDSVNETIIDEQIREDICMKLVGYRLVDELQDLHKGKHIRWIRRANSKLTNGGVVVDIKFLDNGTQILCMNSGKRFIQYKYDECVTFQKLSQTESLILMIYEHAETIT